MTTLAALHRQQPRAYSATSSSGCRSGGLNSRRTAICKSEQKGPSKNARKSATSKGFPNALRGERESNDLRLQPDHFPEQKTGGGLVLMCWPVFKDPVHLAEKRQGSIGAGPRDQAQRVCSTTSPFRSRVLKAVCQCHGARSWKVEPRTSSRPYKRGCRMRLLFVTPLEPEVPPMFSRFAVYVSDKMVLMLRNNPKHRKITAPVSRPGLVECEKRDAGSYLNRGEPSI